jgi:hypothetical protein
METMTEVQVEEDWTRTVKRTPIMRPTEEALHNSSQVLGVAKKRRCTQCKRYRTCMLLNVAAHNVRIRNRKVSKRERHITYSVTKHTYVF